LCAFSPLFFLWRHFWRWRITTEYSAASSAGGGKKSGVGKQHNTLPFWGNETSMNLNPLILANIQSSSYFKGNDKQFFTRQFGKVL